MRFDRGRDFERAIPFLARAAETALQRATLRETLDYDGQRALQLLERATAIVDRPAVELRLRMMQTVALVSLQGERRAGGRGGLPTGTGGVRRGG